VVLPLLKAARRCLLVSGTPAFADPIELWPQLSVLGSREANGGICGGNSGIWCDEKKFMSKYVKGEGNEGTKARYVTMVSVKLNFAFVWRENATSRILSPSFTESFYLIIILLPNRLELHTLLTSTVMIRRMKADILKNLPPKIRAKLYIEPADDVHNEFTTYMQLLCQGKGVIGELARGHIDIDEIIDQLQKDGASPKKNALLHLYKISGRSKVNRVTQMLLSWLADKKKGKLCIFAHHLEVLDSISSGAGLSNAKSSTTKYIRIDGSTSPEARQEQILRFQTDPAVR
jgi:hypothetical protein